MMHEVQQVLLWVIQRESFLVFLEAMTPGRAISSRCLPRARFLMRGLSVGTPATLVTQRSLPTPNPPFHFWTPQLPFILSQCCLQRLKGQLFHFWVVSLLLDYKFLKVMNVFEKVTNSRSLTLQHAFNHLFDKYLLSTYQVPCIVLDAEETTVKKTDQRSFLTELIFYWDKQAKNIIHT